MHDPPDSEAITLGYPRLVGPQGPRSEPGNLGPGWVGFDFATAFSKPVKMVNDAAMQALGSYEGGRMLFRGLGTGLGSALVTEHVVVPLELGRLPYDGERRPPPSSGDAPLVALGEALVRLRASEAGLAYELVAARADLQAVVSAVRGGRDEPSVRTLEGWRRECFIPEIGE